MVDAVSHISEIRAFRPEATTKARVEEVEAYQRDSRIPSGSDGVASLINASSFASMSESFAPSAASPAARLSIFASIASAREFTSSRSDAASPTTDSRTSRFVTPPSNSFSRRISTAAKTAAAAALSMFFPTFLFMPEIIPNPNRHVGRPDFIGEGRLAAELLQNMMDGKSASARTVKVGVRTIVHRESTVSLSESGRFVNKVLAYINREAVKGIGVENVAQRFKVSRSLLELRFGQLQHESVYEAMLRIRLEEVKRRLSETDDSIAKITADCGWTHPDPPKRLFKKRFGVSMRDYRAQSRSIR